MLAQKHHLQHMGWKIRDGVNQKHHQPMLVEKNLDDIGKK